MKNILVINPPNKPFTNPSILAEPLDVLGIATIISEKYKSSRVIDMDALKMSNNINDYLKQGMQNILIFVYDYQIPLHKPETINNIKEIIKNAKTDVKTIIISKTASFYYQTFLDNGLDIIVEGAAEDRINKIIRFINDESKLLKIKGLYFKDVYTKKANNYFNYNKMPIVNRDLIDGSIYMDTKTMITSRGCNGICQFCTTPFFFGGWSARSAEDVIKEIELLINKNGVKQILFLDDNFTVDKKRVIKICKELIKRKIKIKLGCLSSIKNFDEQVFILMYEAGFRWVHLGIESGSERILKEMNKQMQIADIKRCINILKRIGFRIRSSYILDYPQQKTSELIETLKLINELETHEVRIHYLARRVGTPLFFKSNINEQYIHASQSFNLKINEQKLVNNLISKLIKKGYYFIGDEVNWNEIKSENLKYMVSLVPMKYGVNWDE